MFSTSNLSEELGEREKERERERERGGGGGGRGGVGRSPLVVRTQRNLNIVNLEHSPEVSVVDVGVNVGFMLM